MKAVNVLLALAVSLALALLVLEGGLRLLGMGPTKTINRFDPELGWVKAPGVTVERKSSEFDVTFQVNALGLRDDEMASPAKPAGTTRVVMLGDSFVLGYTVDRQDLFVDQLEHWWKSEGRPVDVINAGTEGYATDQEVLWLETRGKEFQPDVVLLFPYENDLYLNAKTRYDRYPKPRFNPNGEAERIVLQDPGPPPFLDRCAIGKLLGAFTHRIETFEPVAGKKLPLEWVAYFEKDPTPMPEVKERTRGALASLKRQCSELGAKLLVVPIPNKACVEPAAKKRIERQIGIDGGWSTDHPVDLFMGLCQELGIPAADPRPALRAEVATAPERHLYYQKDWHLNPEGNGALARFVHAEVDRRELLPAATAPSAQVEVPAHHVATASFGWAKVFALLWAFLSIAWILTYRGDPAWQAPLKVFAMLALIFTIALGGGWVLRTLPSNVASAVAVTFVLVVLGFILWKLGRRVGTIAELFACFVGRGHWYLIPLVVVLLSVGSLLVVAASSPLVAPFIYTLF